MIMNNQEQKSIEEVVLNKIKSGEVKMRPKIYFVLKTTLIALSVFVVILFVLYLVSFIVFTMRASGAWFLPGFGPLGARTFLFSLPWILILIAVILIVALEVFAKHFTFVYRRPIVYSMLIIIALVLLGGFIIERTSFHPDLFWRAREGHLPLMGRIYRDPNMMVEPQNVHHGVVSELTEEGFRLKKSNDEILNVVVSGETQFPFEKEIKEGDIVVVMGERNDDTVQAFGVRRINDELDIFQRRPPRFPPEGR